MAPLQMVEVRANHVEESASMKAGARFAERAIQVPIHVALKPIDKSHVFAQALMQFRQADAQQFVSHGAGLETAAERLHSKSEIHPQHFAPPNGHDPAAALGFN